MYKDACHLACKGSTQMQEEMEKDIARRVHKTVHIQATDGFSAQLVSRVSVARDREGSCRSSGDESGSSLDSV
jgi:hypothetical protein